MATFQEDTDSDKSTDGLKHVSILNDEGMAWGLPAPILYGGVTMSLAMSWLLAWYIGIGFAAIYFTAMYAIHKDDPKALRGWIAAATWRRQEKWSGGATKSRKVYYLTNKE